MLRQLIDLRRIVPRELDITKNCEWIEFSFNLFELFYPYRVLLYILRLSYRRVTKKGTCYDVINIVSFQSTWIYLNEK